MADTMQKKSDFLSILHTWPEYFQTYDEGLGTTYERFILHRYFERIRKDYAVKSLIEVPSFGMTGVSGINSLWWAKNGVTPVVIDIDSRRIRMAEGVWHNLDLDAKFHKVERFHNLPFDDKIFDMAWNFASLWFVSDMEAFLKELDRLVKKVIFICVPNQNGLGYKMRKLFNRQAIEDFYPQNCNPKNFLPYLNNLGWQLREKGYLDIPPWPDIAMKKEDLFKKIGLGFLLKDKAQKESKGQRTFIGDYFSGKNTGLDKEILKYDILENVPSPIKQLWGHHRYFIFSKLNR